MNTRTSIYNASVTDTLVVKSCITCGIAWGQPAAFEKECRRRGAEMTFYCPNGHRAHYTEGDADRERRKREQAEADAQWYREAWEESRKEREAAENSLRTTKGHLTRVKRRIEAGVCIHCNRTFQDVARHMVSKHSEQRA